LSESRDCFRCENILLEEALADELFQLLLEASIMDGFVSLAVVVEAVLFCSGR